MVLIPLSRSILLFSNTNRETINTEQERQASDKLSFQIASSICINGSKDRSVQFPPRASPLSRSDRQLESSRKDRDNRLRQRHGGGAQDD